MPPSRSSGFSRRERQIMDIVYGLGSATASEIHGRMADSPTLTTVRGLLRILVEKGHLQVRDDGVRYVYRPRTPRKEAGKSVLSHVIKTFFGGSPSSAMAAMLGSADLDLSSEELQRLSEMVRRATVQDRKT